MNTPKVHQLCCILLVISLPGLAQAQARGAARPSNPPAATQPVRVSGDYVLQPQDIIKVSVFQEEDINKQGEVGISSEHTVTLPLIGTVSLRGKTVRQAEDVIRALYDKDYLVNPTVGIQVLKYSDRSVNVTGAVEQAGRVQFPQERGLTILDAITLAGGYTRLADLKRVRLTRKNQDGEPVTKEVNVDAITKGTVNDVPLQVGDSISIPERIL